MNLRGGKRDLSGLPPEIASEIREHDRDRGPDEALNFGAPADPRPAASIILLRRGEKHSSRGLEVLLAKRSEQARFMPGVWVFPGGSVDPEDGPEHGDGTAQRACAARELREEVAIELAQGEELILFARWITPEMVKSRFDAWFFLALAPRHSPPKPDGTETSDAGWFTPSEALEAHQAGEISLVFPTIRQLQDLLPFGTSAEALEAYRTRQVEPILPKPVETPEGVQLLLPGDPGYPT